MNKALEEVIQYVVSSSDYKKCMKLKDKMEKSQDVIYLVEEIKVVQKQYVKSNYSKEIKVKLDYLEDKLNNIPIYVMYVEYLEKVNGMINYIKDELNDYFYKLLNESS